MNERNTQVEAAAPGRFRPRFALYHPNAKGTGGALQLELHPAHDNTDGCIMMQLARQMSVGDLRGSVPQYPRFDWGAAVCVKLDFFDLTKMLQVFRGECESLEDGKGLYHRTPKAATRIVLRHIIEPRPGYALETYRTASDGGGETSARIFLPPNEAGGICKAIEASMTVICFGIPGIFGLRRHAAPDAEADGIGQAVAS